MVHRPWLAGSESLLDLSGPVAFAWLALDEPGTSDAVQARLAEEQLDFGDLREELELLVAERLVEALEADEPDAVRNPAVPIDRVDLTVSTACRSRRPPPPGSLAGTEPARPPSIWLPNYCSPTTRSRRRGTSRSATSHR